mgnify:CR=1 FL=1
MWVQDAPWHIPAADAIGIVAGRKLLVVDGRTHQPHDIERSLCEGAAPLVAECVAFCSHDAAGNVLGLRPGSTGDADGRAVVVCAHLDTVFPAGTPLTVRREGPRLVGPGIDVKARHARQLDATSTASGPTPRPSR